MGCVKIQMEILLPKGTDEQTVRSWIGRWTRNRVAHRWPVLGRLFVRLKGKRHIEVTGTTTLFGVEKETVEASLRNSILSQAVR